MSSWRDAFRDVGPFFVAAAILLCIALFGFGIWFGRAY
jgi:hypothetical protein